jgi:hypothetical protein
MSILASVAANHTNGTCKLYNSSTYSHTRHMYICELNKVVSPSLNILSRLASNFDLYFCISTQTLGPYLDGEIEKHMNEENRGFLRVCRC